MQNKLTIAWIFIRNTISKIDLKVYAVCLVISSFIWLIMTLSDNYDQRIDFPVSYSNYPEGMILVNKPPSFISVDVNSQGFELASATLTKRKLVNIDISKIKFKKTKYNRYVAAIATNEFRFNVTNQLKVDDVGKEFNPDSIYFVFDSLVSRDLPVKIPSEIQYKDGFTQYGEAEIVPSKVKVSGPALTLGKMHFVSTDTLKSIDVIDNIETQLNLQNPNPLVVYDVQQVSVKLKTEKYSEFSQWIPITVKSNVPSLSVKTFPSKVNITFRMALPDYKNLSDTSFEISVYLDSLELLQQNKLIPELTRKPEHVEGVQLNVESVDYVIIHK